MPDISYYLIKGSLKRSLYQKPRRGYGNLLVDISGATKKSTYEKRFFTGFKIILVGLACLILLTGLGSFKYQGSKIPEGSIALINEAIEESMILKDIDSIFLEKEEE